MGERQHLPDRDGPPSAGSWNKSIRERWRRVVEAGTAPIKWASSSRGSLLSPWYTATSESIAYAVARRLLVRHWLLVLDELQLLDVSSATLLSDVLSWYWRMGGVIVGTSNRVPDDLYRNGVQRERLEPFVEALKVRCPVVDMRSETDWRKVIASEDTRRPSWYTADARADFDSAVTADGLDKADGRDIPVFGRKIRAFRAVDGVVMFSFSELCFEALGPADYISIAANFHSVYITDIPVLRVSDKNQARRFISLIDALYEARCRIVALADAIPQQLFFPDDSSDGLSDIDVMMAESIAETRDAYRPNVLSYDAPRMQEAPEQQQTNTPLDKLSIFSGQDEQFAFKRALSRLLEMTSPAYAHRRRWLPVGIRQWENTTSPPSRAKTTGSPAQPLGYKPRRNNDDDFAQEACYGSARTSGRSQPPAPHISQRHIWGIEDHQEGSVRASQPSRTRKLTDMGRRR